MWDNDRAKKLDNAKMKIRNTQPNSYTTYLLTHTLQYKNKKVKNKHPFTPKIDYKNKFYN